MKLFQEEIKKLKLRYFSLFTNKERSAAGLKIIIGDFLGIKKLEVIEFQSQTIPINDSLRCKLGTQNHMLGDAHIGSSIKDRTLKVKVIANDISHTLYQQITKNTEKLSQLKSLLNEFLKKPLQIELQLNTILDDSKLTLGNNWNQLGVTSALGRCEENIKSVNLALLD